MPESKGRSKKPRKGKKRGSSLPNLSPPEKKPPWIKRGFFDYFNLIASVITVILFVIAIVYFFKPLSEKLKDTNQISGELKPPELQYEPPNPKDLETKSPLIVVTPPILTSRTPPKILGIKIPDSLLTKHPNIQIYLGPTSIMFFESKDGYYSGDFYKGINFSTSAPCKIEGIELSVQIIANRLYISTSFWDVENNNLISRIQYNKWIIYRPNEIGLEQSDSTLQITDPHGFILTRIKFYESNKLLIQGYFSGAEKVWILDNFVSACFDKKSQKSEILSELRRKN